MGYLSIDIECTLCNQRWDDLIDRESLGHVKYLCPGCGGEGERVFSSVMGLKASYPDGLARPGWKEAREINKLKAEKLKIEGSGKGAHVEAERKRISRQIKQASASMETTVRKRKAQEDVIRDKVNLKKTD